MWWPSPAKLNLFLHITGRNDRGYHNLQTLFQMLDYGDEIQFDINTSGKVTLHHSLPDVADDDNLIVRAANALKRATDCQLGAHIEVKKVLPMGGGLGGGSSNAATTLVALNHLWQLNLSVSQLAKIGIQLGADVPVFVEGKTAFAEGVGEKLLPCEQPEKWFLVAHPGIQVSTAEVFAAADLPRNTALISWQQYSFDTTHNDCQKIVMQQQPKVAKLLRWLIEYAPSRMTGTGACCFAIFEHAEQAQDVLQKLPDEWSGFVARGVNDSPLLTFLSQLKRR
ncbi:4-(cytidine 5'-diphospho)-2-C-methyl-D-erythritol kinase [Aestuariibacter salexigens]|uniref:4-(cytidine 5'-diphospho)-2-C-methyl-D-erythritol kinase n=1 Tax=Aestuariibacter salexigens TaxID=226010 RepID=UPI000417DAAD|nr:4-(cytidine 5'-diphospho)-2-C-methyl-D-erythritol kinase [Aestuariibacter salexigens]